MAVHMRFAAVMDLDSASALSSAAGSPKMELQPPRQQQQPQGPPPPQRQFSGHLMFMDMESQSNSSNVLTPTPPASPGGAARRQAAHAAAEAALAAGQHHAQQAAAKGASEKLAGVPFTPPSDYVDKAERTLFFARVSSTASTEEVAAAFAPCGTVESVNLFRAWPTAKASKGCGLVVMATSAGADAAIAALDKQRTWEGADGPMVVERCDPARLGVKAANAAAGKALRAAASASSAAPAARRVAGSSGNGLKLPAMAARSAPIPAPPAPVLAYRLQPPQHQRPMLLVPAFPEEGPAAARGFSAPLLGFPAEFSSADGHARRLHSDQALSGPLAPLNAAGSPLGGLGAYDDSAALRAAPAFDLSALSQAQLQPATRPADGAQALAGAYALLPQDGLQAPAWPTPQPPALTQAVAAAGALAASRGQLLEGAASLNFGRGAAEALLQQQQQQLELLLLQQQLEAEQQQLLCGGAPAAPPQLLYPADLAPPPRAPAPPPQQQQQMALPITAADLAIVRAHAPTLALLSGATLSVDADAADAAALGLGGPQQQLWLLVTGSPPQLQSASTLVSRLLGAPHGM